MEGKGIDLLSLFFGVREEFSQMREKNRERCLERGSARASSSSLPPAPNITSYKENGSLILNLVEMLLDNDLGM